MLDSELKTPVNAKVIHNPGQCLIITTPKASEARKQALEAQGAEVLVQSNATNEINLQAKCQILRRKKIFSYEKLTGSMT